jgi:hypothetical protein
VVDVYPLVALLAPQFRTASSPEVEIDSKISLISVEIHSEAVDLVINHIDTQALDPSDAVEDLLAVAEVLPDVLLELLVLLAEHILWHT